MAEAAGRRTVLYVGGLEESVNEAQLHAAFIAFGDIKDVTIPLENAAAASASAARPGEQQQREREQRPRHRGFGFVEYEEREDAEAAMDNMNDAELFGRTLRVNFAAQAKGARAVWENDADTYFATDGDGGGRGDGEGGAASDGEERVPTDAPEPAPAVS